MCRSRTSPAEQYQLVMNCRQSGLSDARWCEENGIQSSAFYNWVTRLRKKGCEIPPPASKEDFLPTPHQDVVRVDLVPDAPFVDVDFSEIPEELKEMTADYRMNLVEIRKFEDTSVFKTDVRQVFDFIRCAEDKDALRKLVEGDVYYEQMEADAFDVVTHYTKATELIQTKREYERGENRYV